MSSMPPQLETASSWAAAHALVAAADALEREPAAEEEIAAAAAAQLSAAAQLEPTTTTAAPPAGILRVTLHRASGLRPADLNGLSDPYVKLQVRPSHGGTRKTKVCSRQLDPVWDETFAYGGCSLAEARRQTLLLEVWDRDLIGRDDALGTAEVPCATLLRDDGGSVGEVRRALGGPKAQGSVVLRVEWRGPPAAGEPWPEGEAAWPDAPPIARAAAAAAAAKAEAKAAVEATAAEAKGAAGRAAGAVGRRLDAAASAAASAASSSRKSLVAAAGSAATAVRSASCRDLSASIAGSEARRASASAALEEASTRGVAIADFAAEEGGELSFAKGEALTVLPLEAPHGWWVAQNADGRRGLVPRSFLKAEAPAPAPAPSPVPAPVPAAAASAEAPAAAAGAAPPLVLVLGAAAVRDVLGPALAARIGAVALSARDESTAASQEADGASDEGAEVRALMRERKLLPAALQLRLIKRAVGRAPPRRAAILLTDFPRSAAQLQQLETSLGRVACALLLLGGGSDPMSAAVAKPLRERGCVHAVAAGEGAVDAAVDALRTAKVLPAAADAGPAPAPAATAATAAAAAAAGW